MSTNENVSGVTDSALAALNAQLDDLDLELSSETIVEEIEEVLEASGDVVEEVVEETMADVEAAAAETVEVVIEETVTEPAVVQTKANILEDLDLGDISDDELSAIEAKVERQEIYQTQSSTIDTDGTAPEIAAPAKVKAERKAKATGDKKDKAPKTPKDLASIDEATFQLFDDQPADKTAVMALRPAQVKIAEKFDNLFAALSVGKAPSVYVMTAFEALDAKKTMSSAEVSAVFKTNGHTDGTANSQSGQIMNLFATVGIATRNRQSLELNAKSTIAARLRKVIADRAGA